MMVLRGFNEFCAYNRELASKGKPRLVWQEWLRMMKHKQAREGVDMSIGENYRWDGNRRCWVNKADGKDVIDTEFDMEKGCFVPKKMPTVAGSPLAQPDKEIPLSDLKGVKEYPVTFEEMIRPPENVRLLPRPEGSDTIPDMKTQPETDPVLPEAESIDVESNDLLECDGSGPVNDPSNICHDLRKTV